MIVEERERNEEGGNEKEVSGGSGKERGDSATFSSHM